VRGARLKDVAGLPDYDLSRPLRSKVWPGVTKCGLCITTCWKAATMATRFIR